MGGEAESVLSSDGKNQRSPGVSFMGTLPAAVPIGVDPRTPDYGSGSLWSG